MNYRSRNSFGFVQNRFGSCFTNLYPSIHFLNLRDLLFNLGGEDLDLVLLLRDGCLQILQFEIKHGLVAGVGNGLGLDAGGFTGISAGRTRGSRSNRQGAQPSIGIDPYHTGNPTEVVNVRTVDIADVADVIVLAKATVYARKVTDDNIVIDDGDPGPGHSAYGDVNTRHYAVLESQIANDCVVDSAGVPR